MTTSSKFKKLKVSDNRRYLAQEDGTPFFWLGDTAWELFHRLNKEEALEYLQNRAEAGFTVIQAVALSEFEGLTVENAYGRLPLLQNGQGKYDPLLPDLPQDGAYGYWEHMDFIINAAAELGLYIGLLPTWGDKYNRMWGKGPEIFTKSNAKAYGEWIASRYKANSNIIWILGGDRPLVTSKHFDVIQAMAEGIKQADGGEHLITFHPMGGKSSSQQLHDESWLDFNMIQSGHGALNTANNEHVSHDYGLAPVKPTLDAEPCYEDHPINFKAVNGYFDAADVRQAAYWALFAGAFGHTYGHHSIWSMTTEQSDYFIMHWRQAIVRPGAMQMRHARRLIESRPFFDRIPDQSLVIGNDSGANHIQASRGADYAFFYSPNGLPFQVRMGIIAGESIRASWYDPRTGETQPAGLYKNEAEVKFFPPSSGRNDDWVLILDDDSKGYAAP
ncbi:glycoside hydrolase family 140 protein [Paenibacillus sepulcri]|uniref:Glycoside hydrolase family 140 protein n=1 Tax=Paenibacillus sepulcri TaxID=359917 RepID=A0ABS7C1V8_9BACL|nr:glycoside hydrolase family 140 protein [Paenibacillus sepulcri]